MSQPRPAPARPGWLVPLVVIVLAAAVSGGIAARGVYRTDVDPQSELAATMPSTQPGSTTVRLTRDAQLHPEREKVRTLLQNYFDSINERSYRDWSRTVTEEKAAGKPESVWREEFGSTKDTDALVYRISSAGTGTLRILLGFTSVQDPADAPEEFRRQCIRWRVVFGLTADEGVWKVDEGLSSGARPWEPC